MAFAHIAAISSAEANWGSFILDSLFVNQLGVFHILNDYSYN